MCELLEKTIVIRWDPLHHINRAHVEARGKLCHDIEDLDDDNVSDNEDQTVEIEDNKSALKELIDFIQNKSKKMRTGIEYSKMKEISGGMFKRPKVWSSTRMVVYEFEMVERFLENAMYLGIPSEFLILAKSHLLTMFALKIILKKCSKTWNDL